MLNPCFGDSTAAMGVFPPTGVEYIAASLKGLVGQITLLDLRYTKAYQDPEELSRFIRAEIDLLCIGIQWDAGFEGICSFISQLPSEVTTVVGGRKATEEVEYLFERCPNIDMIVRGEGEEIIRQVVRDVPRREIRGLSYRQDGTVVHNENHDLPDLQHIAFPDRSLRGHDYYWSQYGIRLSRLTFDTVLTTRGCPFKCKFCTFSLNPLGQKREYTERPVESVIEELKTVTADIVLFSDDNMFTNPKRAEQLCDLIIENGIKKTFVVQARIDVARHRRLLDKAQQAGFRVFLIGVESPHDRILTQLQKGITQKQIREAFAVLTQYDFTSTDTSSTATRRDGEEMLYNRSSPRKSGWIPSASTSSESRSSPRSRRSSSPRRATTIPASAAMCIRIATDARSSPASATASDPNSTTCRSCFTSPPRPVESDWSPAGTRPAHL